MHQLPALQQLHLQQVMNSPQVSHSNTKKGVPIKALAFSAPGKENNQHNVEGQLSERLVTKQAIQSLVESLQMTDKAKSLPTRIPKRHSSGTNVLEGELMQVNFARSMTRKVTQMPSNSNLQIETQPNFDNKGSVMLNRSPQPSTVHSVFQKLCEENKSLLSISSQRNTRTQLKMIIKDTRNKVYDARVSRDKILYEVEHNRLQFIHNKRKSSTGILEQLVNNQNKSDSLPFLKTSYPMSINQQLGRLSLLK